MERLAYGSAHSTTLVWSQCLLKEHSMQLLHAAPHAKEVGPVVISCSLLLVCQQSVWHVLPDGKCLSSSRGVSDLWYLW